MSDDNQRPYSIASTSHFHRAPYNYHNIVACRVANPDLTLQAIGDKFNVTRERVRQILNHAGVPTKAIRTTKRKHKKRIRCPKPSLKGLTLEQAYKKYGIQCEPEWMEKLKEERKSK
jgi:hypothetical protein